MNFPTVRYKILLRCVCVFITCTHSVTLFSWSHLYKKIYSDAVRARHANKKEIIFSKSDITAFTQLVVSWNAQKPKKGHFVFHVQVRENKTKKWGKWHCMYEWGHNKQRSHYSKSDETSSYHHVRLEAEKNKTLDGFHIKVVGKNENISLIHGLFANASDEKEFSSEVATITKHPSLHSVHVKNVGKIAQLGIKHKDAPRICSPSSCAMVYQFLKKQRHNVQTCMQSVFDYGLKTYGSWPFNVSHLFDISGGSVYVWVQRLCSFSDLHTHLDNNVPVIVSVRGALPGALKHFTYGHLLVVVGFDARTKQVICHDPACYEIDHVEKRYALKDFVVAWEKSRRLVYCVAPIKK